MKSIVAVVSIIFFIFGENDVTAINVTTTTSAELQDALDKATSGDLILLLPQEYVGNFHISRSGHEENVIEVRGTQVFANGEFKSTVVSNDGSGVIFDVNADFVKISSMTITNAEVGIEITGSHNRASSLTITEVHQGVIINGDHNKLMSTTIKSLDIGVQISGNQNKLSSSTITNGNKGVVINGDKNTVKSSTIKRTADTALTVEKGTDTKIGSSTLSSLTISSDCSGGTLSSTTIKGKFDLQGSGFTIKSVTSRKEVNIQGCDNRIQSTSFTGGKVRISSCNRSDSMTNSWSDEE